MANVREVLINEETVYYRKSDNSELTDSDTVYIGYCLDSEKLSGCFIGSFRYTVDWSIDKSDIG